MAALPALSSAPNATMTPVSSSRDTAVIDAWKEAGEKYKKSLSKKDLLQVQIPTGPADIVKEIESWHLKVNNSKSTKVATAVGRGLAQLQRFTASIDMLAQGSPAPGCLLWGSIKFALTVYLSFPEASAVKFTYKICFLNVMYIVPYVKIQRAHKA